MMQHGDAAAQQQQQQHTCSSSSTKAAFGSNKFHHFDISQGDESSQSAMSDDHSVL
jgi:hypothetical protein